MYHAKILTNPEYAIWEDFVAKHPLSSIHQTPSWGEFQARIASRGKFWLIGIFQKQISPKGEFLELVGGTLLVRHGFHRGKTWLYSARGPLLDYQSSDLKLQIEALLKQIREIAKEENSFFYRLDPPLFADQIRPNLPGFYSSHLGFQPENTLILNLKPNEDRILEQMKSKGRYNIRLASRKNIKIVEANPLAPEFTGQITAFHRLIGETTARDNFYGHKKQVYRAMLEVLQPRQMARLYLAYFNGIPIAGIIVTFYKDTAIYYYGASANNYRNLMAPYLLQWQAIKDAKAFGCEYYDFLGISPENYSRHAWAGVTDFKLKFGGQRVVYQCPQEYPLQKIYYWFFRFYKIFR